MRLRRRGSSKIRDDQCSEEDEALTLAYLTGTLPTVAAVDTDRPAPSIFLPQNDDTNLAGVAGVKKSSTALAGA